MLSCLLNTHIRDIRKSWQKIAKNPENFCENRKNHGKVTASNYRSKDHYKVYKTQHLTLTTINTYSAKFLCKILSLWSIKIHYFYDDVIVTYLASK